MRRNGWVLRNAEGRELQEGAILQTFQGLTVLLVHGESPHTLNPEGYVWLREACEPGRVKCHPSAIGAKWHRASEQDAQRVAVAKPLHKTTIVIWSEYDGDKVELMRLARAATEGNAYCSKQDSMLIEDPTTDPDWDGTEFFGFR